MRQIIAIDGPSGSGKTTLAKLVARELGYHYLDTGALYRAVALFLRKMMIQADDSDERLREVLKGAVVRFRDGRLMLNGEDITDDIRSSDIDHYSSVFSARRIVRDFLLEPQRNAALENDLVIEGRDTTTVVFPAAQKKVFLDASVVERAKRRSLQYKAKGIEMTIEEAMDTITERDERDTSRHLAPLARAPDALLIDSSNLSIEDVKNAILAFAGKDR